MAVNGHSPDAEDRFSNSIAEERDEDRLNQGDERQCKDVEQAAIRLLQFQERRDANVRQREFQTCDRYGRQ